MENNYSKLNSPIGPLHVVSDGTAVVALVFDNSWQDYAADLEVNLIDKKDGVIKKTEKQLKEYFAGKRRTFDVPVKFSGTVFQNSVWKSLMRIPYGKTISYGEQAKSIKKPNAVRAVGGATGRNKICIIVPCHRVIGKNGSLTGFGGGLHLKEQLLKLENSL